MSAILDVRQAIREANDVFSRFPVQVCLPLIVFGLVSGAATFLQLGHPFFLLIVLLIGLVVMIWVNAYLEAVVATMYLRAHEDKEPGVGQFGEVLGYRGLAALVVEVTIRSFGWFLLLALISVVVGLLAMLVWTAAQTAGGSSSGIGAVAGGATDTLALAVGAFLAPLVLWRYTFAYPMFAIARGSESGFLGECIARTGPAWKTAAVVMLVGSIPSTLGIALMPAWAHVPLPHSARVVIELTGIAITNCFAAWLVLLKTGLAMQLMSAPLPGPPQVLADSGGTVDRIGPPSF